MHPWREPVPAVEVDPEEDRLEEEREGLKRERKTDHAPPPAHEPGPEEAEGERQDRPAHRADGEQDPEALRPALRERHPNGVAGAVRPVLRVQEHHGQADPQAREDDVEPQRDRHLDAARLEIRERQDPAHFPRCSHGRTRRDGLAPDRGRDSPATSTESTRAPFMATKVAILSGRAGRRYKDGAVPDEEP
jgi:hypothetical protein